MSARLHLADGGTLPVGKILCVGRNFAEHAAEMQAPAEPVVFLKPATALVPPGDPVRLPRDRGVVHHEVEIAVWLRDGGTDLEPGQAERCLGAVGPVLDLTLRDVQTEAKRTGKPWTLAKGFDGALPTGWFRQLDGAFPEDLVVAWMHDGSLRQQGRSRGMLLGPAALAAFVSRWITLEPGDLLLTGTPAGVGPVAPGDTGVMRLTGCPDCPVRFV